LIVYSSTLFGIDEIRVEDTIEKAQKSLFTLFDVVGTSNRSFTAPFFDCSKNCEKIDEWKIPIRSYFLSKVSNRVESEIFRENRFDQILKVEDELIFENGDNQLSEKVSTAPFLEEIESFETFRERLEIYINNTSFLKPHQNILKTSLRSRITFDTDRAISEKLSQKLLSKSYLFAIHLDHIEGEFRAVKSRKDDGFKLNCDLDIVVKALLYKFDPKSGKMVLHSSFDGGSFNIGIAKNLQELYSLNYFDSNISNMPTIIDGEREFKASFEIAFREALDEVLQKITEIEEFKTLSPVLAIKDNYLKFHQVSERDALRIDAPFYLQEFEDLNKDGEVFAWGKVREVGNYDGNGTKESIAQLIGGDQNASNFDYIFVPFWNGIYFNLSTGLSFGDIGKGNGSKIASVQSIDLKATSSFDLGYIFNYYPFSDIIFNLSLFTSKEDLSFNGLNNFSSMNFSYLYGYESSLQYKYYPRKVLHKYLYGLFLTGSFGVGGRFGEYDVRYYNEVETKPTNSSQVQKYREYSDGSLNIFSHYLALEFGIGYSFSPSIEFVASFAYQYQIYQHSSIDKEGVEVYLDYMDTNNFQYSDRYQFLFGLNIFF
jgi:hypothetical protein